MLDLICKLFKVTIKFNELREIMLKEIEESMMTMSDQIENISMEIEIAKKNQMEILKWKSTITETENSQEELSSKFQLAKKNER